MRFVDGFRDPHAARALVARIVALTEQLDRTADDPLKFMEVCGGHTHTIYRHGLEHLLPPGIELVHGPGCPVCVIPMGRIDDAIWLAEQPGVIFATFGDMMRVPGSRGSLLDAKARGADVRFVYSPLDALDDRAGEPRPARGLLRGRVRDHRAVDRGDAGACPAAGGGELLRLRQPRHDRAADTAILDSPDLRLDGFLGPGHVSTVVGMPALPLRGGDLPASRSWSPVSSRSTSCSRCRCC